MEGQRRAQMLRRIEILKDTNQPYRYHSSAAFVLAVGEHLLGHVDDQARRMMAGSAGGLGGSHEELCGALSTGELTASALYGRTLPDEAGEPTCGLAAHYRAQFLEEWGTTRCADLRDQGYGSGGAIPCTALIQKAACVLPNNALEQTRPARRDNLKVLWPGRSIRGRWPIKRGVQTRDGQGTNQK